QGPHQGRPAYKVAIKGENADGSSNKYYPSAAVQPPNRNQPLTPSPATNKNSPTVPSQTGNKHLPMPPAQLAQKNLPPPPVTTKLPDLVLTSGDICPGPQQSVFPCVTYNSTTGTLSVWVVNQGKAPSPSCSLRVKEYRNMEGDGYVFHKDHWATV